MSFSLDNKLVFINSFQFVGFSLAGFIKRLDDFISMNMYYSEKFNEILCSKNKVYRLLRVVGISE